jgi:hypothetical protein
LAKSRNTQQIAHVTELEEANALLRVELDTACSKLVKVERRERTLTSENEVLDSDLEGARTARNVAVKGKEVVQQVEQMKPQWFQDSIHERLTELWRDNEASVAMLGGRSADFPAGTSLFDFFKWF